MKTSANSLPLRPFGQTDLRVTPLCVGCAPLGDMPETFAYSVTEDAALATLRAAFAGPINFADTAASYGDGESERRIGLALRELGGLPDGYVLGTKADRDLNTGDFSGEQIKRSVERSLRLLGLDQLQIVFLHDPEHTTFENAMSRGGPVEVLHQLKDQGLIKHIGVAGGPTEMEIRYVETGAFEALMTHNRYTLLNRSAAPLLDIAAQRGLAVINAAPYGSGILAKGPDAYARYAYQDAPAEMVERTRRMAAVCAEYGVPLAAAALQFSLRDPRITSTVVGMSRAERIAQTLDLARQTVPDELWPRLDAIGFDTEDPEAHRFR
jgi:D-threo-aldose 1-dehydrogenase